MEEQRTAPSIPKPASTPVSRPAASLSSGIRTNQSPPFTLPMRYMILGILCFGLFAVDLAIQSGALVQDPTQPSVIALTHLLTLGALLAFVMGAVYQLATVAFLIPVVVVRFARWNFWLYLIALTGLWWSMQTWFGPGLLVFGSAMALAIFVYCGIILASIAKTAVRGPIVWFVASAHSYLALAITAGIFLVLTDAGLTNGLNAVMNPLLATHIVLAAGGFFTFLLMGFSIKLLPMFTLSHGYPTWREKWTFFLLHAAIWMIIAGAWSGAAPFLWLGALAGVLGFANHLVYAATVIKHRMRKIIESPIRFVITAATAGFAGLFALLIQVVVWHAMVALESIILFYIWGCVTLTVMAYTYKIIPFLVWSERYGHQAGTGKGKVPMMADLLPLRYSRPVFWGYSAGVIITSFCLAGHFAWGVMAGCLLVSLSILSFSAEIWYVIDPRKVAGEMRLHAGDHMG